MEGLRIQQGGSKDQHWETCFPPAATSKTRAGCCSLVTGREAKGTWESQKRDNLPWKVAIAVTLPLGPS